MARIEDLKKFQDLKSYLSYNKLDNLSMSYEFYSR